MKKNTLRPLHFITAAFAAITSITIFVSNKTALGFIWACISVTFGILGLCTNNMNNKN